MQRKGRTTSQMGAERRRIAPRKTRRKSSLGRATRDITARQGRGTEESRGGMGLEVGGAQATHRGIETFRGDCSAVTSRERREG